MRRSSPFLFCLAATASCGANAPMRAASPTPVVPVVLAHLSSLDQCRRSLTGRREACDDIAFAAGEGIDAARFDVDGDGARDLIVRRLTRLSCGSHGCATLVYLSRPRGFRLAEPQIVSNGPIAPCRDGAAAGLSLSSGDGPRRCFLYR